MAASDEWTEWHLTETGWQRGSEKTDFNSVTREPPPDRACTAVWSEHISSSFSPLNSDSAMIWKSENLERCESLLKKYGPPPRHL
jgi:hypothetical protein